jgi:hypothetical protein
MTLKKPDKKFIAEIVAATTELAKVALAKEVERENLNGAGRNGGQKP